MYENGRKQYAKGKQSSEVILLLLLFFHTLFIGSTAFKKDHGCISCIFPIDTCYQEFSDSNVEDNNSDKFTETFKNKDIEDMSKMPEDSNIQSIDERSKDNKIDKVR